MNDYPLYYIIGKDHVFVYQKKSPDNALLKRNFKQMKVKEYFYTDPCFHLSNALISEILHIARDELLERGLIQDD